MLCNKKILMAEVFCKESKILRNQKQILEFVDLCSEHGIHIIRFSSEMVNGQMEQLANTIQAIQKKYCVILVFDNENFNSITSGAYAYLDSELIMNPSKIASYESVKVIKLEYTDDKDKLSETMQDAYKKEKAIATRKEVLDEFGIYRVQPFNGFLIDCFTTALYSILLSCCSVDENYIYNNNYIYSFSRNHFDMGRVYVEMQNDDLCNRLLLNQTEVDFTKDESIIEHIKEYLDQKKLIFLGVDMFDWINETSQYQKHHVKHKSLVYGYDDKNQCLLVLETGWDGYYKYFIPYEVAKKAAYGFNSTSLIFDVNTELKDIMYDLDSLKENAKKIIKTIREQLSQIPNIWNIDEDVFEKLQNEAQVHIKNIYNRHKTTKLLFEHKFDCSNTFNYQEAFEVLEQEYWQYRDYLMNELTAEYYINHREEVKSIYSNLLEREAEIWERFLKDDKLIFH